MRFRLSTLLAVLSLASITAAGFSQSPFRGISAYLLCLIVFMSTWRTRVVCDLADAEATSSIDSTKPRRILISALELSFLAAVLFAGGCTIAQVPLMRVMVPVHGLPEAQAQFNRGLWLSMPVATAGTLWLYWLTWPRREKPIRLS